MKLAGSTWEDVRIGDLGDIFTGRTPPTEQTAYFGSDFPFITPGDMHQGKYARATQRSLSQEGAALLSRIRLPANSVCVSCIGWQMGEAIMTAVPSFTNQQINSIVPIPTVDPSFLYYSLRPRKQELLSLGAAAGVRTPILNKSAFSALEVKLPKLAIQQRIAKILTAYDDLIENNQKRIKILEDMARSLYREWFVEFRFPGHENVKMVDSPLGKIPEGWEVKTVQDLIKRGKPGKLYSQKTAISAGAVPILDQGRSGIIGYHNDPPGVSPTEDEPVIIFANHTCYQRIIQYPFSAIQNVIPFTSSPEHERNIYWLHWATKDLIEFNDYKGHWPEFMSKRLLLPTKNICEKFGKQIDPMVRFIYRLDKVKEKLHRTRDLLLPRLLSGQIDVSGVEKEQENAA